MTKLHPPPRTRALALAATLLLATAAPAAAQGPPQIGQGTAEVTSAPVAPGDTIDFTGSDFESRPAGNGLSIKVDDGAVLNPVGKAQFGADDLFANSVAVSAGGAISGSVKLPELGLPAGDHWLRFLAGAAGGPAVSKIAHFDVTAAVYPGTSLNTTGRVLSIGSEQPLAIRGYGATAGQSVAIYSGGIDGIHLGTVTVGEDGRWAWTGGAVPDSYPDGFEGKYTIDLGADDSADQVLPYSVQRFPDVSVTPAAAAPGDTVTVKLSGAHLGAGAEILGARVGDEQLIVTGITRGEDGSLSFKATLPAEGLSADTKIAILQSAPFQRVIDVPVKVLDLQNADAFDVTSAPLFDAPGNAADLYQVAYGEASDSVFVTSSCCFPPIAESTLFKLDPKTLDVRAQITPADSDPGDGTNLFGVYGVATDDKHGTVWTTATRQDTVTVYKQSDLSVVKQFDTGVTPHSRDVLIDEARNRAYVTNNTADSIGVFDTESLTQLATINVGSALFTGVRPMSLDLDPATGTLYSISLGADPEDDEGRAVAIIVKPRGSGYDVSSYPLDGTDSASGIALDAEKGRLWAVSQGDEHNLVVIDLADGHTIKVADAGAGALNAVFDPVNRLAYVADRLADTISVWDEDGNRVGVLDGGELPNHVETDGKGTVYAVNKGGGERGNLVRRISPRAAGFAAAPAISGTVKVGQTVAVAAVTTTPADAELSYQWLLDGAPISGAESARYTLPASAAGRRLSVKLTATPAKPWRAGSATSAAVTVAGADPTPTPTPTVTPVPTATPAPPVPTPPAGDGAPPPSTDVRGATLRTFKLARPKIAGRPRVGKTLRVTVKRPAGAKLSYVWKASGKRIAGARGTRLKLTRKLRGERITITVTAKRSGYRTVTRTFAVGRVR